jgi:predicted RNA methylase
MKKKELERILNLVPRHPSPKIHFEQYSTPATLAATMLWIAEEHYHDISGKRVVDLGSGTGRLGLGAAVLGGQTLLLDIDYEALQVARSQAVQLGIYDRVDLVATDVLHLPFRENIVFDTVIQNPPFGVHRKGSDIAFLEKALALTGTIYSLHKANTISYIRSFLRKHHPSLVVDVLLEEEICIPPEYMFHRKRRHCFKVSLIRVHRPRQ